MRDQAIDLEQFPTAWSQVGADHVIVPLDLLRVPSAMVLRRRHLEGRRHHDDAHVVLDGRTPHPNLGECG